MKVSISSIRMVLITWIGLTFTEASFVVRQHARTCTKLQFSNNNNNDRNKVKSFRQRMRLFRPVTVVPSNSKLHISTGLTFDDGDQLLVSAQKPLGLILEEEETMKKVVVTQVLENSSASRAGVQVGDWIVAVQNADVSQVGLDEVIRRISEAPKVVNLRFHRYTAYVDDYCQDG
uniref:PDZ domain-containing protein n=1 Tax=Eucampia antarctica TaxID=49252 RepID=A0A7S2R735_9STRA|mmetsp:Transcript_18081/g.17442  ORF Transcript_18081/g.17442 Transcript_18081/m.17442 type:complete len:175 (+) Transcript_18081:109-633(+)